MNSFDVIVIGSGPGGYVAAIRCAQLGMKTAMVEKYKTLGGTCLNVGCIPSKAMLDSTEHFFNAAHTFADHGIKLKDLEADLPQMIKRKDGVVQQTVAGIDYLMKKNKITVINGLASFVNPTTVKVTKDDGTSEEISGGKIVIATGSKPSSVPGVTIDKKRIISSTEALNLQEIPKHFVVIGGGVIGMEMGSVYARLGAKVSVLEFTDSICGGFDKALSKELQKVLTKQGFTFYLQHKVTGTQVENDSVKITATSLKNEQPLELTADYVLVSTGRRAFTEGLELEKAGLKTDDRGRIPVNEHCETEVKGIFAIGDVVRGAMLAHKAEDEGALVAEIMAGQKPHINYNLIPGVVYTWPEVAGVGKTEEELKAANVAYKAGSFPFKASGRSRASMDTDGFVKVLADAETDEILGVHMIGPRVADIIAEAVIAMEFRASAEDIARASHAHPTYTEAVREAAMAATENRAIHI
jgi:dihydrolipoamide dehydrogenase